MEQGLQANNNIKYFLSTCPLGRKLIWFSTISRLLLPRLLACAVTRSTCKLLGCCVAGFASANGVMAYGCLWGISVASVANSSFSCCHWFTVTKTCCLKCLHYEFRCSDRHVDGSISAQLLSDVLHALLADGWCPSLSPRRIHPYVHTK